MALKPEFFVDKSVSNDVYNFLENYFSLFDSSNREPLMQAYDESSKFSVAYFKPEYNKKMVLKYFSIMLPAINIL